MKRTDPGSNMDKARRRMAMCCRRSISAMLATLALFVAASPVRARLSNVPRDGTGDSPTIQAAMDSACAGDSIVVALCRHLETLDSHEKKRVLLAEHRPEGAVLDGEGSGSEELTSGRWGGAAFQAPASSGPIDGEPDSLEQEVDEAEEIEGSGNITFEPGLRVQPGYRYDWRDGNNDHFIRRVRFKGKGQLFDMTRYYAELLR